MGHVMRLSDRFNRCVAFVVAFAVYEALLMSLLHIMPPYVAHSLYRCL